MYKKLQCLFLLVLSLSCFSFEANAKHKHKNIKAINSSIWNSKSILVYDDNKIKPLFSKNQSSVMPIASITKLMTAIVYLDNNHTYNKEVEVVDSDVDRIKFSSSKLPVGSILTVTDMIKVALMSSENRAASALARTSGGDILTANGEVDFIKMMNIKARQIGMTHTHFDDAVGISQNNVSTAEDLMVLLNEAKKYDLIKTFTTDKGYDLIYKLRGKNNSILDRITAFRNTNAFLHRNTFEGIMVGKTGFTNEAGVCIVMETLVNNNPIKIVLLNSGSKQGRDRDVAKLKKMLTELYN